MEIPILLVGNGNNNLCRVFPAMIWFTTEAQIRSERLRLD